MRNLITASVALASLAALAVPASAKEKPISQAVLTFTDNYATALGLQAACPAWRIDQARAALGLAVLAGMGVPDDAYEVAGPLHDRFMAAGMKARSLGPDMGCDTAEMLFGPGGAGAPGFMKKR